MENRNSTASLETLKEVLALIEEDKKKKADADAILKEQVLTLLEEAKGKKTDIAEAIDILFKAEKLLPQLASDDSKGSERNVTQGKSSKEILYSSKRGNILYELKDYKEAAVCYKAIKDSLPNNPQAYKAYGDCLRKLGQYDDAIMQYEDGLKIDNILDSQAPEVTARLLNSKGLAYLGRKQYQEALADFEAAIKIRRKNPLYHCNSGHAAYALGEKQKALEDFKKASELIYSTRKGDLLTKPNISYIQETQQFIQQLIDALPIEDNINEFSRIVNQGIQFKETIQNLELIKLDQKLYQYYDGFMFTLIQSYNTSSNVLGDKLVIKTGGNPLVNLLINSLSVLPLLSKVAKSLQEAYESADINKSASMVCSFATTPSEFEEMAKYALCKVILEKDRADHLRSLNDEDLNKRKLPKLFRRIQKFANGIEEFKNKAAKHLYGERYKTPLQKFGYQTATSLVSDHIASGEIYGNDNPVMISCSEKTTRLIDIIRKVIDQSLENS